MSTKENNLKEKFKIALTSTAKVIADDFDVKKKSSEEKKSCILRHGPDNEDGTWERERS